MKESTLFFKLKNIFQLMEEDFDIISFRVESGFNIRIDIHPKKGAKK